MESSLITSLLWTPNSTTKHLLSITVVFGQHLDSTNHVTRRWNNSLIYNWKYKSCFCSSTISPQSFFPIGKEITRKKKWHTDWKQERKREESLKNLTEEKRSHEERVRTGKKRKLRRLGRVHKHKSLEGTCGLAYADHFDCVLSGANVAARTALWA